MLRATTIEPHGVWTGALAGEVQLDSEGRRRRRYAMTCTNGLNFLLDLEHAPHLHDGDTLVLEDGRRIGVSAAPEPLAEITARDAANLVALAYHLGNRHLEAQLFKDRILIRPDHVIEEMVRGLGGKVAHVNRPFEPASGAYGGGHHHD
ncbi:MAG: urease accessory protein UreE [Hyphomicrobiales bacterium]|nr:urease accessory protein UreE [Hyphomicrobiales bacterium]